MTGMCGGRGVDDEDEGRDAVEVGGGRWHGEVFAGAGRSGGGEERLGELLAEAALVVLDACLSSSSSPSSSLVSMTIDSCAAAVSVC